MGPDGWEVSQRDGGVRIHQPSHIATGDFSRGQGNVLPCPRSAAQLIGEVSHRDGGVRIHQLDDGDLTALQ